MTTEFTYTGLSGRPAGPVLRVLSAVLPGVRRVQEQVVPYARAWQRHNTAALAADGPLWVALGDSLTVGIGASAHDRGWVGQLAAGMPGWRVVNLGVSGGRVRDVLDRQLPALASLGQEPELVTLLIGNNDLVSPRLRAALPADLAELLRRVPAGTVVGNQPATYAAALEVNRLIDEAVTERGLRLAELRDPRTRSWSGKLAADRFHPNDAGYAGIAAVFAEAIAR